MVESQNWLLEPTGSQLQARKAEKRGEKWKCAFNEYSTLIINNMNIKYNEQCLEIGFPDMGPNPCYGRTTVRVEIGKEARLLLGKQFLWSQNQDLK